MDIIYLHIIFMLHNHKTIVVYVTPAQSDCAGVYKKQSIFLMFNSFTINTINIWGLIIDH